MALYLMGDIQGCAAELAQLLNLLDFSPSRDTLYALGDMVNRGPASAAVLRRLCAYGDAARCILGNHDLHLLALAAGLRQTTASDSVNDVLQASDREALLHWLRHQALARYEHGWLMVHAGVLPSWSTEQTLCLAEEVGQLLRQPKSEEGAAFMRHMYGNEPRAWSDDLHGHERHRVVVNALTRLRFCSAEGAMDFKHSGTEAPAGLMPWFEVPHRRTQDSRIAFGHWSSLGLLQKPHLLGLDSACVWGGTLSAAEIDAHTGELRQVLQTPSMQIRASF